MIRMTVALATGALLLGGCVATHERPMNPGEKTIVSDAVAQKVEEAGGRLDTRDDDTVICDRFKRTGTHMVTRVCYTLAEKRALEERNQREYNRRFGPQQCLDRSSVACQGGLERPAGG